MHTSGRTLSIRTETHAMPLTIGQFVQSTANTFGIGKVARLNAEQATVEYFESPAKSERVKRVVPVRSLKAERLETEVRVYFEDPNRLSWQVGRVLHYQETDKKYLVRFPNDERRLIHESHLLTRWLRPIDDPTDHLALQLNETPYWYEGRSAFIHSVYSQRHACGGMPAVLSSAIDLAEHQISVVRHVLQDPFQRYLLADEVGLGKTIEAGVLIRQFVLDERDSHHVVVIVPAPLIPQWKGELRQKFHLGEMLGKSVHVIGHRDHVAIANLGSLAKMVVIDEAHHVAAWAHSKNAFLAGLFQSIAKITEPLERRVLLLSATPVLHNETAFLAMLHLIDPVVHSLDDLDGFRQRVKLRQEVAESMASLTDDESNFFLGQTLEVLSAFSPDDRRFQELHRQLAILVERDVPESDSDRSKLIHALRSHISETWRLHRRLIRNRRTECTEAFLPGRGGCSSRTWDSPPFVILEELVKEWRLSAARSLYESADSDVRHSLGQLARVLTEAAACDPSCLPAIVSLRLCGDSVGTDKMELFDIETQVISETPHFDGERDVLERICRLAKRFDDHERLRCLELAIRQITVSTDHSNAALVVFTNYPSTADRVFAFLRQHFGVTRVLRHDPETSCWTRFVGTSDNLILVCDRRAEEGLNLRNQRAVAIHYDLPLSANRIEQRMGRLDRFGTGRRIPSIALVASASPDQNEWFRCLDRALKVFDRSVASLQYVVEAEFRQVWSEYLDAGADALSDAARKLGGDDGAIEQELRRIRAQDELDAFERDGTGEKDFVDNLESLDLKASRFRQDLEKWMVHRLHFRLSGEEGRADDVVRYQFCRRDDLRPRRGEKDTLMAYGEFLRRFDAALDDIVDVRPPVVAETKLVAFDRQTSQIRETSLARIGDPLVDAIEDYIRWDDRGICFAMWRYRPLVRVEQGAQLSFRFDLIAEADHAPLRQLLDDWPEISLAALRRRADMSFPPIVGQLWMNSELERITDKDQLRLLNEPYRAESVRGQPTVGRDFNLSQERWPKVSAVCDITVWRGLCYAARERAEVILREQTRLRDVISDCAARATESARNRIEQYESRLSRSCGDGALTLHRELEFERAFSDALQLAIHNPSVRIDSIGAVFLSPSNPFENEASREDDS